MRKICWKRSIRLDRWPEKVRIMQRNWIGKSEGLLVRFMLDPKTSAERRERAGNFHDAAGHVVRRDVHRRCRRIIRSPTAAAKKNPKLKAFIDECHHMGTSQAAIDTAEKMGFDTGIRAAHPFDPSWMLPVYVANFVLMDYGTGAIFGCPAHDQRDLDFVSKYNLGNTPVVCPPDVDPKTFVSRLTRPLTATAA